MSAEGANVDRRVTSSTLFWKLLWHERVTLFILLLIFSSLFFILYGMDFAKKLYVEYTDTQTAYLPKYIIETELTSKEILSLLQRNGLSAKSCLVASKFDLPHAKAYISQRERSVVPKKFTLLAFHFPKAIFFDIHYASTYKKVPLQEVYTNRKGVWSFKTDPIGCKRGEKVRLALPEREVTLLCGRTTSRYTKLLYKAERETVDAVYDYLVSIVKSRFLGYAPFDRYALDSKTTLKTVALHTKMLKALFSLLLSPKCALANRHAFEYFGEDYSNRFHIKLEDRDFSKEFSIVGTIPFSLEDAAGFSKNIILANAEYLREFNASKRVIFVKDSTIDLHFIPGKRVFRESFGKAYMQKKERVELVVELILVSLLLFFGGAIVYHFVNHLYLKHLQIFRTLSLYGKSGYYATAVIVFVVLLAVIVGNLGNTLLVNAINDIFYEYFVDFIGYDFDTEFVLHTLFALVVLVSLAAVIEMRVRNRVVNNYKGGSL